MNSINTALLGLGRWGQLLHQASLASDHLNITTVVGRSIERIQQYCSENSLAASSNLDKMLQNDGIDAVIIATPHSQHFQQLMSVAEAGKHVYCEKPFTLSATQANTALNALKKQNCKVAVGHNRRFAPNTLAVKQLISDGWFGDLVHIDGVFNAQMAQSKGQWRDSAAESPAGGMTSLGIHVVDMFINLMGNVSSLRADSRRVTGNCEFDDHTTVNLNFSNEAGGLLTTLTNTAMQWRITLYGSKGWACIEDQDTLTLQPVDGEREIILYPGYGYPAIKTLTSALDAFALDISNGDAFPVTPEQVLHGTEVLEAIIQSASSGVTVSTPTATTN